MSNLVWPHIVVGSYIKMMFTTYISFANAYLSVTTLTLYEIWSTVCALCVVSHDGLIPFRAQAAQLIIIHSRIP